MQKIGMRDTDLAELYTLLTMYSHTYSCPAADALASDVAGRYNGRQINNPRNAGRRSTITQSEIDSMVSMRNNGKSIRDIASLTNHSVSTVHKLIREHKEK